ncbi:transcriptional coactivator p15 (PC4) domain-containing protein [Ditylenchus destructor]|nr:transcriptional coactivator p15 (PC4) domain-containing protein [Ditylenchus destructor]
MSSSESSEASDVEEKPVSSKKSKKQAESKSKKRAAVESDSDPGVDPDDLQPKSKQAKNEPQSSAKVKKNRAMSASGEELIEIGKNKYVSVTEFKGTPYVNIREYYEKDGKLLPSKKGISLNRAQYTDFKKVISEIDEMLNSA